jgi:hypothetical protein
MDFSAGVWLWDVDVAGFCLERRLALVFALPSSLSMKISVPTVVTLSLWMVQCGRCIWQWARFVFSADKGG